MSISIEQHSDTIFTVTFNGVDRLMTTVTSSGAVVEVWLDEVQLTHTVRLHSLVVGLDAEWKPSNSSNYQNPTALLQLCVGRRCLLFQLLHADYIPEALSNFLLDDRFTFVGVGIGADADRILHEQNLRIRKMMDLRELAVEKTRRTDMGQMGLAGLARAVMGVEMRKARWVRTGPWDRRDLSWEQIKYAAVDAFVSFEVGRRLFAGEF